MSIVDELVGYMERSRHYYRALGYERDYVWARFDDVPFAHLAEPLGDCRIALITTAAPPDFEGVRKLWSASTAEPPEGLKTAHLAWDKESRHTDDRESFLPVETAAALAADGIIAGLTARLVVVPTTYSHRQTMEQDAPGAFSILREDGADAAVLSAL
jgi:D-proline reductase (dithiol) PrdB